MAVGLGRAGVPADVLPPTRDIALGPNWFPLERDETSVFRWAENDAVIHVAALVPCSHVLRLVLEPGPGAARKGLTLTARLLAAEVLRSTQLAGKSAVPIELPPSRPRVYSVELHADGGGARCPGDPRILNFRLFEAALERHADVMPPWAKPAKGFYELESFGQRTFRWVNNDAVVMLHAERGAELSFDVEPGPGLNGAPFTLEIRLPGGELLAAPQIASATRVCIPLAGLSGADRLTLRVAGGGKYVPGDPRIMNFRVFAAS
jgi:hypothetical protein